MKNLQPIKYNYNEEYLEFEVTVADDRSLKMTGTKCDRNRSTKEIAKILREEFKQLKSLMKDGEKIYIRSNRHSITCTFKSAEKRKMYYGDYENESDQDLVLHVVNFDGKVDRLVLKPGQSFYPDRTNMKDRLMNPRLEQIKQKAESIASQYNYDNSDSMVDYFDTLFYFFFNFDCPDPDHVSTVRKDALK